MSHGRNVFAGVVCTLGFAVAWGSGRVQASDETGRLIETLLQRSEAAAQRPFDARFRLAASQALAALPAEELEARLSRGRGIAPLALGDSNAQLVYTPVTPCRLVDTRLAGGSLAAGVERIFKVAGGGLQPQGGNAAGCGIPSGPATAVVINFVAVNPTGPGNLRAWAYAEPAPTPPAASIINYTAVTGLNLANGVVVPICDPALTNCPGLDLVVRADTSGTHLVADALGYFQRFPTEEAAVPAGAILDFGGATAPNGYLLCDGSLVSRATYARLFSVIGTSFGNGNGSTTFHLPDLRGRFTRGRDAGAGRDPDAGTRLESNPGGGTGDAVGSVQSDLVGPHSHRFKVHGEPRGTGGGFSAVDGPDDASPTPVMADGGGIGQETRPKNIYVNRIIKY